MGTEINRLKNENKRTKTSIQRMKSFHNQRKLRGNKDSYLPVDQDGNVIERRIGSVISKNDSDRKLMVMGAEYSDGSHSGDLSDTDFANDNNQHRRRK